MIEIVVSYSGKISKPKYENVESFWSVKEVIDTPMTDEERNARMLQIKNDLQKMFELDYKRIHDEQEPKPETKEEPAEKLPKIKLNLECGVIREKCYEILMSTKYAKESKVSNYEMDKDIWEIMKGAGITADKLNDVETWKKVKESL